MGYGFTMRMSRVELMTSQTCNNDLQWHPAFDTTHNIETIGRAMRLRKNAKDTSLRGILGIIRSTERMVSPNHSSSAATHSTAVSANPK